MSARHTRAPSEASLLAVAAPMPLPEPTTMMALPFSLSCKLRLPFERLSIPEWTGPNGSEPINPPSRELPVRVVNARDRLPILVRIMAVKGKFGIQLRNIEPICSVFDHNGAHEPRASSTEMGTCVQFGGRSNLDFWGASMQRRVAEEITVQMEAAAA